MKKIAALDIGGTNTRVALIDENYNIEKIVIRPTVVGNVDLFLDNVLKTIEEAIPDCNEIEAFACGVPGRVRYDGFIYALPNVHIDNVPLTSLSKKLHKPFYVLNDAEVAALSEANVGPYKDCKSLYFVTISTGVGGAFTRNGKLVSTSYEIGHTMTKYRGEIHEFEHLASGTGIIRLCDMNGLNVGSAKDFFNLVRSKYPLAMTVYNDWLDLLADFFKMIYEAFTPEIFTLTGGVMKSSDLFFDDLKKRLPGMRLEICGTGQNAGLLGSAVYGFQKVKENQK